jgi:hypothetical protein
MSALPSTPGIASSACNVEKVPMADAEQFRFDREVFGVCERDQFGMPLPRRDPCAQPKASKPRPTRA